MTDPPAAGPPPMRFPRARMALGVLAAAFSPVAILTIYASHGVKMISFARLTDVGILAAVALGVAVAALVLALITLIALRRRIAYADRMNAAAAAELEPAAADVAELDAATDAAIDRAYAGPHAEPAAAVGVRPEDRAGPVTVGPPPLPDMLRAPGAPPRRNGSAVEEMRAAAVRASTAAASMGERLQQLRPVGGDGTAAAPRRRYGSYEQTAPTTTFPAVQPAADRVVAPAAPARRTPSAPVDYPPTDVGPAWPLPAPWSSPLASDDRNGADQ